MKWAIAALVAVAVLDVAGFGSDYLEYDLYDRVVRRAAYAQQDIDDADLRQGAIALLQLAAFIAAIVLFLRWFHRSYRNLRAVGGNQRYGEGWAIGAWFVPFLNLYRPKQIANDIWRGSDPALPNAAPSERAPVSPLLGWWWAAFLVSTWADNIAARLAFNGDAASDIRSADLAQLVGDVLDLIAAVLAIAAIRALTARQSERATELCSG